MFNSIFLFRRLIFAAILTHLSDYPIWQIFAFIPTTYVVLIFIGITRPFTMNALNYLELFNEMLILFVTVSLFCFTDFSASVEARYNYGWGVVGLLLLNILVQLIYIVYKSFMAIKQKLKQSCKRKQENVRL